MNNLAVFKDDLPVDAIFRVLAGFLVICAKLGRREMVGELRPWSGFKVPVHGVKLGHGQSFLELGAFQQMPKPALPPVVDRSADVGKVVLVAKSFGEAFEKDKVRIGVQRKLQGVESEVFLDSKVRVLGNEQLQMLDLVQNNDFPEFGVERAHWIMVHEVILAVLGSKHNSSCQQGDSPKVFAWPSAMRRFRASG